MKNKQTTEMIFRTYQLLIALINALRNKGIITKEELTYYLKQEEEKYNKFKEGENE